MLDSLQVTGDKFVPTCVIVDKLDKLERAEVEKQLQALDIPLEVAGKIIDALSVKSLEKLAETLGKEIIVLSKRKASRTFIGANSKVVKDLQELVSYAESYGIADWLQFDASVSVHVVLYTVLMRNVFA